MRYMKPTEEDYHYLIDQLTNSMEFYGTDYECFITHLAAETNFSSEDLKTIWDSYAAISPITSLVKTNSNWGDWINRQLHNPRLKNDFD